MSATGGNSFETQNHLIWERISSDPGEALEMADRVYTEAEKCQDRAAMSTAIFNRAWALVYLGRNQEAIRQFNHDLAFFTEPDSEHAAWVYNGMVAAFSNLGILDEALDCLAKVHEINEKTGRRQPSLIARLNTGWMNIELEQWDKALEHLRAVEAAVSAGDQLPDPGNLLEAIGICLVHLNRYEDAEDYFRLADLCPQSSHDELYQVSVALNRSIILEQTGQGAAAMAQAGSAMAKATAIGNQPLATKSLLRLIEIRLVFGPVGDSRALLDETLAMDDTAYPQGERIKALILRSTLAEQAGDLTAALRDLKEARRREARLAQDRATIKLEVLNGRLALEKERRAHEAARIRNQDLELLNNNLEWVNRLGSIVNASLDWNQIAHSLFDELKTRIPLDSFGIARCPGEQVTLEEYVRVEATGIATVPSRDCPRICTLVRQASSDRVPHQVQDNEGSLLAIPLILFDEVIAVMFAEKNRGERFDETHLSMLEAVAPVVAASFKNAESFTALSKAKDEIYQIANHDALTGLYNRRFLFDFFDSWRSGVIRNGQIAALFYLDLDRFKPINDRLGHKAGDRVLCHVANCLTGQFRESDICGRIGGDEFVVLSAIATPVESDLIRKKIHDSLALPLTIGAQELVVKASIGLALDKGNSASLEEMLHIADTEMLANKQRRR